MLLPEVTLIQSETDTVRVFSFNVPKELEYFKGHFPTLPVLPGVVQVHWAMYFANQQFSIDGVFSQLDNLKFHAVILPETQLELTLQWHADTSCLDFTYRNAHKKYSAGRVVFHQGMTETHAV